MLDLVRTETPQVTVVPARIRLRVCELLEAEGIPYEQVNEHDFKDGWDWGCTYRGVYYTERIFAFVTTVTTESLLKAAEDMWLMGPKEIQECVEAHKTATPVH